VTDTDDKVQPGQGSPLDPDYERVHTMTDYYDGPRRGIADFNGRPHLYESEWDDLKDEYASTFRVSPVEPRLFELAIESWAIWRRWETAFHEGKTTQATHPALPEDRPRHEELQRLLAAELKIDDRQAMRAGGDFKRLSDPAWNGLGFPPIQVKWTVR
jgi:hypothetical protein